MATPKGGFWNHVMWRIEAAGFDAYTFAMRSLSPEKASDVGAWIARTFGPLTGPHRTAERNIRLAFPDMTAGERKALLDAQWESLGRVFGEYPQLDRILAPGLGRLEIVNAEGFQRVIDDGPAVFISGHFSNFEVMAAAILQAGVPCHITYRPMNNPYIEARMRVLRARYGVTMFAPKGADGARSMIEGLRRGESVALLNDQKFNDGVAAPFFGRMVMTAPGPSQFALRFKIPLVPLSIERTGKARYRAIVHDPVYLDDTGDRAADILAGVTRVNAFVEDYVRRRPQEWFWVHKRWPKEAYRELEKAA